MQIGFTSKEVLPPQAKPEPLPQKQEDDDILKRPPWRWLAYSNGIGESILRPMTKTPAFYVLAYSPALMYMGADIFDKYKKGEDGTYKKPSVRKFIEQSVYQGFASMLLTGLASAGGRTIAAKILKLKRFKGLKAGQQTGIKILGGITALAMLAKPIDKFTEKYIIKGALEPMLYEDKKQEFLNKYFKHLPGFQANPGK